MHWYKRDPDAALIGMAELTLQERGAYNGILDLIYSRGGALNDDDDMIARVLSVHGNEWRAVKRKLIAKGKIWITPDGNLMAKRVEKTLKEAANFSETQRKRVGKRWEKHKNVSENNCPDIPLPVIPIQPQPQPHKKDIVQNFQKDFLDFYSAYPKKQSKRTAEKAYESLRKRGVTHSEIMDGLSNAKRSDQRFRELKFTPMPASWLNAGGYADETADRDDWKKAVLS